MTMSSNEDDLRLVGGEEPVFDFPSKIEEKGDDLLIRYDLGETRR
jgi:hypothetical protein